MINLSATLKRIALEWLFFLIKVGLFLLIVTLLLIVGPTVEGKFFPVVTDTHLTRVGIKDDHLEFLFTGDKIRQCTFDEISAIVKVNNEFVSAKVEFLKDSTDNSRPMGHQVFGVWAISPVGSSVILTAKHHCHTLWDTVTPLIRWDFIK